MTLGAGTLPELNAPLSAPVLRNPPHQATLSAVRMYRGPSRKAPAAVAVGALLLVGANGCVILNPAYDEPSTSGESGSESESGDSETSNSSMTIGDTEGEKCESDRCLYLDPPSIACYEFEDEADILTDERGCGRDGAVTGIETVPGVYGKAARIADVSSIEIPGGVWPELPNLTITAWIALPPSQDSTATLFRKPGHFQIGLIAPPDPMNNWKVSCAVVDNVQNAEYSVLSTNGAWNMISCGCIAPADNPGLCSRVFSSVNANYKEGNDSNLSKPLENDAVLEIAPVFGGCIDSVQVWDRALKDAELVELYNHGKDNMPAPCLD